MAFAEQFLEYPDLFPARRGGESWGAEEVVVDFAGGPYRFEGLAPEQADAIRARFEGLCLPPSARPCTPHPESHLFRVSREEFRRFDVKDWVSTLDFDYAAHSVRFAGLLTMGRLDWCPEIRGALWACEGAEFLGVFENFFRVLVSYRLLEVGGVLLHSAGVLDREERAVLFLGPSGAGKTTVSRLSAARGYRVLSDDLNALLSSAGRTVVEKMPFAGDFGNTSTPFRPYPLRILCRLEKSQIDRVEDLSPARSLALLVSCSPGVNGDPHRAPALEENLERLLREVPTCSLRFSLDGTFWRTLDARNGTRELCS